jgi:LysR family glycine cleavage system transcriptional activator
MDVDMIAVCSPKLNATRVINTPADLAKFPLLHHSSNRWAEWMAEVGITLDGPLPGHTYQNFAMVAQAAVAGLGIALLPRYIVEEELAEKQLEIVGSHIFATKISYYLIVQETHASSNVIQTFAKWLMAEARKYGSSKDWVPEAKTNTDLLASL